MWVQTRAWARARVAGVPLADTLPYAPPVPALPLNPHHHHVSPTTTCPTPTPMCLTRTRTHPHAPAGSTPLLHRGAAKREALQLLLAAWAEAHPSPR